MTATTADDLFNVFGPAQLPAGAFAAARKTRFLQRFAKPVKVTQPQGAEDDTFTTETAVVGNQVAANERVQVIQQRMVMLAQVFYEDYGQTLNQDSQAGFNCLMQYNFNVGMPLISAESTGLITATWMQGSECLSLRFTDRHRLDFAVTYLLEGEIRRNWGPSNLATLFESVPQARRIASGL